MIVDFLFSDKLGSTVFAPVKMDFVGNIKVGVWIMKQFLSNIVCFLDGRNNITEYI